MAAIEQSGDIPGVRVYGLKALFDGLGEWSGDPVRLVRYRRESPRYLE